MPSEKIKHLLDQDQQDAPQFPTHPQAPHSQNPYDFITNPPPMAKKKLLPGGDSKNGRLIVIAAGGLGLILLIVLVMSLLGRAGGSLKQDYLSIAQQQTELIRISDTGLAKAKSANARNLAATAKYTLTSEQPAILQYAKKAGVKTDAKSLRLGRSSQTDKLLLEAEQSSRFDEVFTKTMRTGLIEYQQALKKVYDATNNKLAKETLSKHYDEITTLIGNEKSPTSKPVPTSSSTQ